MRLLSIHGRSCQESERWSRRSSEAVQRRPQAELGTTLIARSDAMFHLTTILSRIEMALRRSNQSAASEGPLLEAADEDPAPRPSRPGVGPGKSPVILRLPSLEPDLLHDNAEIGERNHEGPRHLGDRAPPNGRRAIIDPQRPLRRVESGNSFGILAAPCRRVARRKVPQVHGASQHRPRFYQTMARERITPSGHGNESVRP
jgi:hypothetical protein